MDPRIEALEAVNLNDSRIHYNSKAHIVLLCGGRSPSKTHPDAPQIPICSLRHALVESHEHKLELFKPEDVTDWNGDGAFKNLLDLEVDLASISSLVVVILESEGAIAELGAFSQLVEFDNKIKVIVPMEYAEAPSFIELGIFRHIRISNKGAVKYFPWEAKYAATITAELTMDVASEIQDELNELPATQLVRADNSSHVLILIHQLIDVFVALKEGELYDYLTRVGIRISKDELKRKLFLLQRFRLISREVYSDSVFYVVTYSATHHIVFTPKAGSVIDRFRLPIQCRQHYKASGKDKHRLQVIKRRFGGGDE